MRLEPLHTYYFVHKVKNYKQHNKKLLELIKRIPRHKYQEISHTDWQLPRGYPREYLKYFYKMIKPLMNTMRTRLKMKSWAIDNGWFQRYRKTNVHPWHTHPGCNYTNVYYLQLSDGAIATQILDQFTGKIIKLNVKEGEVVSVPGHILHRSPENKGSKIKTIISFNSNFYEYAPNDYN